MIKKTQNWKKIHDCLKTRTNLKKKKFPSIYFLALQMYFHSHGSCNQCTSNFCFHLSFTFCFLNIFRFVQRCPRAPKRLPPKKMTVTWTSTKKKTSAFQSLIIVKTKQLVQKKMRIQAEKILPKHTKLIFQSFLKKF